MSSTRQQRILVYLHSFGPGGVERVALRLAGAWASEGHDVRVLMGRTDGPERNLAPDNVIYDFAPPHPLARPFETLWMVIQLVIAIRRHRPDVLFCAGNTYTVVAALVRLILRAECPPFVCKFSNSLERRDLILPVRMLHRLWIRLHGLFIEQFVGLSPPMAMEIERLAGVPRSRIAIIPNPVLTQANLAEAEAGPVPSNGIDGTHFVAVGRLTKQKNFLLLIRAFARIAKAGDVLTIIGEGPERDRLRQEVASLSISNSVELPGHRQSVLGALRSADVFVSSSDYEGMPGAVVEAMAVGLPIVATDSSPCVRHMLGDGQFGTLVPTRAVAPLSNALRDARQRPEPATSRMRAAAAAYTVERSARHFADVLASAAAMKSFPPRSARMPLVELADERS